MYFAFCDGLFGQHHTLQYNEKEPSDTEAENLQPIYLN